MKQDRYHAKCAKKFADGGEVKAKTFAEKYSGATEKLLKKVGVLPDTWRDPDDKPTTRTVRGEASSPTPSRRRELPSKSERMNIEIETMQGHNIKGD